MDKTNTEARVTRDWNMQALSYKEPQIVHGWDFWGELAIAGRNWEKSNWVMRHRCSKGGGGADRWEDGIEEANEKLHCYLSHRQLIQPGGFEPELFLIRRSKKIKPFIMNLTIKLNINQECVMLKNDRAVAALVTPGK